MFETREENHFRINGQKNERLADKSRSSKKIAQENVGRTVFNLLTTMDLYTTAIVLKHVLRLCGLALASRARERPIKFSYNESSNNVRSRQ